MLAQNESFVLATQMHWCLPAKATAKSLAVMPVTMVGVVGANALAGGIWWVQAVLMVLAIGHVAHSGYQMLGHYAQVLVVTSHRMFVTSGLVNCTLRDVKLDTIQHDDGARRELYLFVPDPMTVYNAARARVAA